MLTVKLLSATLTTEVTANGVAAIGVACSTVAFAVATTVDSVCTGVVDDVGVGAVGGAVVVLLVVADVELVVVLDAGTSGRESLGTTPATTIVLEIGVVA